MQVPKLFKVGGVVLCNVVALGSLCDMVLDVTVFQLVHLMLAVCVSKLCHDKISMKGLVQVSIMAHPAGGCAVVLLVTAVHVCRVANIFPVIDCAGDAVHIVSLARSSLLGAASSSLPLTAAPSNRHAQANC